MDDNKRRGGQSFFNIENMAEWLVFLSVMGMIFLSFEDGDYVPRAALVLLITAGLGSVTLFTRTMDEPRHVQAIFRFSYGFALLVLLGVVTLFLLLRNPILLQEDEKSEAPPNSVISILPGCIYREKIDPNDEEKPKDAEQPMPVGAYCTTLPQWVINVGGVVSNCTLNGDCSPPKSRQSRCGADGDGSCEELQSLRADQAAWSRELSEKRAALNRATSSLSAAESALAGNPSSEQKQAYKQAFSNYRSLQQAYRERDEDLKRLTDRIESLTPEEKSQEVVDSIRGYVITGGVVVPVYFVIFTLLGAVVGILRKLPEYQLLSTSAYLRDYEALDEAARKSRRAPLTPQEARDSALFQIIQVLAALPLSLVVYAWAKPEEVAYTAVVGFGAGLSAEPFLIAIRALVEQALEVFPQRPKYKQAVVPAREIKVPKATPASPAQTVSKSGQPSRPDQDLHADQVVEEWTMQIGDKVKLVNAIGIYPVGSKAIVLSIDRSGNITAQLYMTADGTALKVVLPPAPASAFVPLEARDRSSDEGPVG